RRLLRRDGEHGSLPDQRRDVVVALLPDPLVVLLADDPELVDMLNDVGTPVELTACRRTSGLARIAPQPLHLSARPSILTRNVGARVHPEEARAGEKVELPGAAQARGQLSRQGSRIADARAWAHPHLVRVAERRARIERLGRHAPQVDLDAGRENRSPG